MFANLDAFRTNGYYLAPSTSEENYRPAWDVLSTMVKEHAHLPEVMTFARNAWEVSAPPEEARSRQ